MQRRAALAIAGGVLLFATVSVTVSVLRRPADGDGPGPAIVGQAQAGQAGTPPSRIERGRTVYVEQKCQACHSIAGMGSRRYPLDGVGSKLSADDIRKWIVAPREMNPKVSKRAFDSLPPPDLEALVAYVSSLRGN
jgi:mono/diheme cytochrome c family protein